MDEIVWYQRFGDIPGIAYETPPGIRRPQLPAKQLRPERHVFSLNGERRESLTWEIGDGATGGSPASRWRGDDATDRSTPSAHILQRVYEQLELPGTALDYHFALLRAYEELRKRARNDAGLFADLERLCFLDITLSERVQLRIANVDDFAPPVLAFGILIDLYVKNGLLDDAMELAKRATAQEQGGDCIATVEARIAALRAEDE